MEEEFFDTAVEGTTLCDLFVYSSSEKIAVLDTSATYGSTYSSVDALRASPYVSDLTILTERDKPSVRIEAIPVVLGAQDSVVATFRKKVFENEMEYIHLKDIFLISDTLFRIPTSKNDIADLDLSFSDKFVLFKAIREQNMDILRGNFSDETHPVYRAFVDLEVFGEDDFVKFCEAFGQEAFVYPVYGHSEVTEAACMINAHKGVTYVLNKNLEHTVYDQEEYKHRFTCEFGTLHAKQLVRQKMERKEQYVRVILVREQKLSGNFLAFIEKPYDFLDDDGDIRLKSRFTTVLGLDSTAQVCDEGMQLLYFINTSDPIENQEVSVFSLGREDILIDVTFKALWDFEDFKAQCNHIKTL